MSLDGDKAVEKEIAGRYKVVQAFKEISREDTHKTKKTYATKFTHISKFATFTKWSITQLFFKKWG